MRSLHALAVCAAALAFGASAYAGDKDGYLVDKDGNIIKMATTGVCVRTSRWTEKNADPDCRERLRKATLASRK